jgi:hypothetical protein
MWNMSYKYENIYTVQRKFSHKKTRDNTVITHEAIQKIHTHIAVFVLVYVHCTVCAVLCDVVKCMCGFLVECMFFCKHCHRAKAQLQLNIYIYTSVLSTYAMYTDLKWMSHF